MARKSKQDIAKQKAAKQKKIAIVGGVLFLALLAFQLPKMMKMMHGHPPQAPAAAPATTTPTVTPADPNTLAAPTLAGAPTDATQTSTTSGDLVSAVPMTVDPGQLKTFEQFASKDPFAAKQPSAAAQASGGSAPSGGPSKPAPGTTTTTPASPSAPPPPAGGASGGSSAPTAAVISVNGELVSVALDSDFPTAGTVFNRSGALFHLVSLTASSAKVAIAGGSYADGAAAVTLQLKKPLTLQNTADGSKYTLILEPPGTAVPAATGAPAATSTPATAVPPTSGSTG